RLRRVQEHDGAVGDGGRRLGRLMRVRFVGSPLTLPSPPPGARGTCIPLPSRGEGAVRAEPLASSGEARAETVRAEPLASSGEARAEIVRGILPWPSAGRGRCPTA